MTTFTGRGHGKLILSGEHAVVYGHPALAVAVDRGAEVSLRRIDGPTRTCAETLCDVRLTEALKAALEPTGWEVSVKSDLPIGRGMGSSAAIAVGLVRAQAAAAGETLDLQTVWERAFAAERAFHGTPSGLDQAVACRGGMLRYLKGPPPIFVDLPCPDQAIVVLDSGEAGDTAQLVAGVRARRPGIDPVLDAIGELVLRVEAALPDPAAVGPLLTENHALLQQIGVSNPMLDGLVQLALDHGAWGAKLAGAGGGGVVIALTAEPESLVEVARAHGVDAFVCQTMPGTTVP